MVIDYGGDRHYYVKLHYNHTALMLTFEPQRN